MSKGVRMRTKCKSGKKSSGQCSLSELKVPCKNSGSLECTDANEECTDAKASKCVRMRAKRKIEKKTLGSVLWVN